MDSHLKSIADLAKTSATMTGAEKEFFEKAAAEAEKAQRLSQFKLERLEQEKRSLSVMLDESIRDLEGKNRSLEIESSLDRVRGRAMAMNNSNDISVTVATVFGELRSLGIQSLRCGVALLSKDSRTGQVYAATTSTDSGDSSAIVQSILMTGHPSLEHQYESWLKQENYFTSLADEELRSYYALPFFRPAISYDSGQRIHEKEYGYYIPFSEGLFYAWTQKPYSEGEIAILNRFKSIIDLTFRRYLDLKKAEGQAREAQIEAALERVRAKAMAMRTTDDFNPAVATVFQELDKLNLGMLRCGIGILNKERRTADVWTTSTSEHGSTIQTSGDESIDIHPLLQGAFDAWLVKGDHSYTLEGEDLANYYRAVGRTNFRLPGSRSMVERAHDLRQYFYVTSWQGGGLFAFRESEFTEEAKSVMRRFASVFNLTFTRFNDLQLAEAQARQAQLDLIQLQAAKKKAEDALAELKTTQEQLIQQEKLASLGQLTAGIAHEIKNPLNFVNNFSDVSLELVNELKSMDIGSKRMEADELLEDIRLNLEKIHEHGSRADGIVKSMLQHSRGSSGKREPTDLNALIKEYSNLAFHGMRAGKNPISADITLDLQDSLGRVKVIAEDFSRVIINLCQNAFDAMREKVNSIEGKTGAQSYRPTLTIRTRGMSGKIAIDVEDNGPGVPDAVKDKIFQPFFTTKKGTQGTGLGLSITHDIVKAHGGELKIEKNVNGGATFSISFPADPMK